MRNKDVEQDLIHQLAQLEIPKQDFQIDYVRCKTKKYAKESLQ